MANERLAPDAILSQTNLSGAVTAIDDDPDSPDASWLTAPGSNNATEVVVSFPTPSAALQDGTGLQEIRVQVRKTNHSTDPTCTVAVLENGSLIATLVSAQTVSSTTGVVLSGTWDAASLSGDGSLVEVRVTGTVGGGSPGNRASLEVGAIEWNAEVGSGAQSAEPAVATVGVAAIAPTVALGTASVVPSVASVGVVGAAPTPFLTGKLVVRLKQGSTVIAEWIEPDPGTTEVTRARTLSAGQVASILWPADGVSNPALSLELVAYQDQERVTWAQVEAPTPAVGGAITRTPSVAVVGVAAVAPSVTVGAVSVSSTTANVGVVANAPTVFAPTTVVPSVALVGVSAVAPTVVVGVSAVAPTPAVVAITAQAPSAVLGAVTVPTTTAQVSVTAQAPNVILGSVAVTPAVATVSVVALDPTPVLEGGPLFATPAIAGVTVTAHPPTVVTGPVAVLAAAALVAAVALAPLAALGNVSREPAPAVVTLTAVAPVAVGTGTATVVVTPALVTVVAGEPTPVETGRVVVYGTDRTSAFAVWLEALERGQQAHRASGSRHWIRVLGQGYALVTLRAGTHAYFIEVAMANRNIAKDGNSWTIAYRLRERDATTGKIEPVLAADMTGLEGYLSLTVGGVALAGTTVTLAATSELGLFMGIVAGATVQTALAALAEGDTVYEVIKKSGVLVRHSPLTVVAFRTEDNDGAEA